MIIVNQSGLYWTGSHWDSNIKHAAQYKTIRAVKLLVVNLSRLYMCSVFATNKNVVIEQSVVKG